MNDAQANEPQRREVEDEGEAGSQHPQSVESEGIPAFETLVRPVQISLGQLDPVLDAAFLPIGQRIIGHRHLRAVLTTETKEVAFLSAGFDPASPAAAAGALHALLVAVCDRIMDEQWPAPAEPEEKPVIVAP